MDSNQKITPLYTTKFGPQKTRKKLVERHRLLNKFITVDVDYFVLSLVIAPSGYGKSTLLAQVMDYYCNLGCLVSWLSLDESDNDEDIFITHLIESYLHADITGVALDQISNQRYYPNANPQARLEKLLHVIETSDELVKIILDDFQVITDKSLLTMLDKFFKKAPKNLTIYIISRCEPKLNIISEYRAKDKLLEISANELNFTIKESKTFFSKKTNLALNDIDIQKIHSKTEGWVAATQLFSLVIPEKCQHETFINSISGNDKDIVKYLGDCVLSQQSEEVKEFFFHTSILHRFNADLCVEMCNKDSAVEILNYVNNQGLFVFGLDRENNWFRYHHLFKEFLQRELLKQGVDKYQKLTAVSAVWHEKEGLIQEAIEYYLLGEQFEKASTLIGCEVVDAVQYRGNHSVLLKWVDRLPFHYTLKTPKIAICYAWSLLFTRDFQQADNIITSLKNYTPALISEQNIVNFNVDMLILIRELMSGAIKSVRKKIPIWLDKWSSAPTFEQGVVLGLLGATCLHTVEFSLARKSLMQAKSTFEKLHCDYGVAWIDSLYGLVHFKQGYLIECERILKDALMIANKKMGEHSFASTLFHIKLSQVYCENNDISQAKFHLNNGFSSIDKHGVIDTAQIGFIIKARIQQRENRTSEALKTLSEGEAFGRDYNLTSFEVGIISERIRILLRNGDNKVAHELYSERGFDSIDEMAPIYSPMEIIQIKSIQIRILLVNKSPQLALNLLNELIRQCNQKKYDQLNVHLLLLNASAHYDLGKKNQSFRILNQVIESAVIDNKIGVFIDECYHIKPLFSEFMSKRCNTVYSLSNDSVLNFIEAICKAYQLKNIPKHQGEKKPSQYVSNEHKIEKLTNRESELLTLLKQGLSNKELANSMFVSESTVKWHLSRIYIKLGVKNRLEATQKKV